MILMSPFQLEIFYGSVVRLAQHGLEEGEAFKFSCFQNLLTESGTQLFAKTKKIH